MIEKLRSNIHLFGPVFLVLALIALGVDWVLSDKTQDETVVVAGLSFGGIALLVLKYRAMKKANRDD